MTSIGTEIAVASRLDVREVLRSRWLLFCLVVQGLMATTFVLVGMRESAVIGFTGMGRALMSLSHALIFLLPLLGLTATGQTVISAREDGSLELLLSHPMRRTAWFCGVSLVRAGALVAPLLLVMPAMAVIGAVCFGQRVPWDFLVRGLAVSSALLLCFVALGLWVSTVIRNQAKALMVSILLWALAVALVDFGLIGAMLQWRLPPAAVFALAVLNPVECARLALLSAAQPELASFGPVGFFIANHVGAIGMTILGIGWPLLLGATAWMFGLRSFRNRDLV